MSDDKSLNNPVYSYRASEELDNDSWGTLVKSTPVGSTWDSIKPTFDGWEKDYRDSTALPLPNSWRSAKSVVKAAITAGVPLTSPSGEPLGKTFVETATKAAKGSAEKDPREVLKGLVGTSYAYATKHGLLLHWAHLVEDVAKEDGE